MPHLFQNVNISIRKADQLPFLQQIAAKDRGEMSRYIRKLVDSDPEYLAWAGLPDTSELSRLRAENKKLRDAITENEGMYNPSDLPDPWV